MSVKSKLVGWLARREIEKQKKGDTMLSKVWAFLDGHKTTFSALLDLLSSAVIALPNILPAFGLEAAVVANVVAKVGMAVGILHKAYKWYYKEK